MAKATPSEPTVVYSASQMSGMALRDLVEGAMRPNLWAGLAKYDIQQRFRRSMLGPLWITLSMGIMIATLALVFGALFSQPLEILLPYLAAGLITWGLITGVVTEAGTAFTTAEGFIRNVPMSLSVHIYRMVARNVGIWMFNMVIFVAVWLIFVHRPTVQMLLVVPGLLMLFLNLLWVAVIISTVSTRYRDIPQVTAALTQVIFFVTPIFWSVELLPNRPAFVDWNPVYHLIEIVRAPLLGTAPHAASWGVAIGLLVLGVPFAIAVYRRGFPRIPYWV